ncbi:MAG: hypothetical protein QXN71_01665 [Candidatus Aenigmatarchaeota archaeon]
MLKNENIEKYLEEKKALDWCLQMGTIKPNEYKWLLEELEEEYKSEKTKDTSSFP